MTPSLIAAFGWIILANLLGLLPSRDNHWRRAYVLIALGVPLLVWLAVETGPLAAILALVAGMSILRWPVIYLARWIRRRLGR
ncbi:MAG: Protein of unknown function (DUF2484) [Rhodobacteraceae bacterium HLUCCA08]|nr:MAG: Protein of unknown function (DUF2484) [Rhodobacteraceae bacterium HLUCCA08]